MKTVKWWVRWFVFRFPSHLKRRFTDCRKGHGPRYDGDGPCLTCGAPWFFYDRSYS